MRARTMEESLSAHGEAHVCADDLASLPVPSDDSCVEIPEKEDTVFKAVRYNDTTTIERCLHEGVDINIRHDEDQSDRMYTIKDLSRMSRAVRLKQYTLLHVAVVSGSIETIEFLLSKGADVNITDQNYISPLSLAAVIQRPDVAKLLLQAGAHVNAQSLSGKTPLIEAIQNHNLNIVRLLVDASADLDLADMKGTTPLLTYLAKKDIDLNIISTLIKGGCTIDLPNKQGATPLMMAIGMGKVEAAKLLLDAGADINLVDKAGKNVFHMAVGVNTALFLINEGAACDWPDQKGIRPIDRAAQVGHIQMIRLLLSCDCHRTTAIMDVPRVIQSRQSLPVFDMWLHQELYNPRELKRLCRQTIRHCLGPRNTAHMDELPVPKLLKDYLLAKHLELTFDNVVVDNGLSAGTVSNIMDPSR